MKKPVTSAPNSELTFSTNRKSTAPIKQLFPDCEAIIKYAFTIGEKDFYEFNDINGIPCIRGFHALSYYNELAMGCTREYLKMHHQALDDIINNPKGKLTDIVRLNMQLKERLDFLIEPYIAYKLCSVVFFDESENPYGFDYDYAITKSNLFKKAPIKDFFLSQPIVNLIPYINSSEQDLAAFCQTVNLITKEHLENISTMLSEESKRLESYKLLMLQMPEIFPLEK